jgi:hypothetical protein
MSSQPFTCPFGFFRHELNLEGRGSATGSRARGSMWPLQLTSARARRFPAPLALAFGMYGPAPAACDPPVSACLRFDYNEGTTRGKTGAMVDRTSAWLTAPALGAFAAFAAFAASGCCAPPCGSGGLSARRRGKQRGEQPSMRAREKMARSSTRLFRYCRSRTALRWTARISTRASLSLTRHCTPLLKFLAAPSPSRRGGLSVPSRTYTM